MAKWIDYSFARPDPAAIRAAGYSGVCRYLTGQGKALTASERDALFAAGLDLLLNFEQNADNAKGGYAQGLKDGKAAANAADALGAPRGMAIYFSVDYDTAASYPAVVANYLKGCAAGMAGRYEMGVYGSYYVVHGAMADGQAKYGWTTVAWSYGHKAGHIFQTGEQTFSHGADIDEPLQADIGSWKQGENIDMALDPKDPVVAGILDKLNAIASLDQTLAQIQIWGDATHPDSIHSIGQGLNALRAQVDALAASVKTGGIDPAALAKAITAHIQLEAK